MVQRIRSGSTGQLSDQEGRHRLGESFELNVGESLSFDAITKHADDPLAHKDFAAFGFTAQTRSIFTTLPMAVYSKRPSNPICPQVA